MPVFGPRGLEVMGVHAQAEAGNGIWVAETAQLSLPMAFDLEREITRFYRVAGPIFPLHILVGPEGRVLHVDNDGNLDLLTEALETYLPARADE